MAARPTDRTAPLRRPDPSRPAAAADSILAFGPFRLDPADATLWQHDRVRPLTPKAFTVLHWLARHAGRLVTKDELLDAIWPGVFVGDAALKVCVRAVRQALDDEPRHPRYIETAHRRGYRFIAQVADIASHAARADPGVHGPPAHDFSLPETRYAASGDVNIAYQVIGSGPLDIVFVMGWVSHLDYFWAEPSFAAFLRRLASFSRLILFDKRGTGLSDRAMPVPTLEQRMDDVRAVMEAAGSKRAALVGVSEGGPMCSLFAATYPEKTAALVMIGTYAKRLWSHDYPWAPSREARERFLDDIRVNWGGPVGLEDRAPSVAGDPRFRSWWSTYLRMGASPGAAIALTRMNAEIDVRAVLPTVRVPTLVLHRTLDRCLAVAEGRYVAGLVPGARFVELPGEDHLPFVGDQDAIVDEIENFLTRSENRLESNRVLTTLLHARVTAPADREAGVARQDRRSRFEEHVAHEIEWFRGRRLDAADEHVRAMFDGPARAIRCASALAGTAARFGLELHAGLHTGECDLTAGGIGGIIVEIAAEIGARASAGEVLVSRTVTDLVAGSRLRFEDRGSHVLPGLPGLCDVFAVAGSPA